ncbi:MAG TPA: hypothetical protein VGO31_10760 [Microbacteriaceae bacterium]|nr:hypothetical protein [Microbacteriaceae bacterium]
MSSTRRATARVFAAAVLVLAVAGPADAKSFEVSFDRATARPGQVVTARGTFQVWPGLSHVLPSVVVYLIPTRLGHANYNTGWSVLPPPGSRGTYRLGRMSERNHHLFLRFTLPHVPIGDYMTASYCPAPACGDADSFAAAGLWGAPWAGKPGVVIRVTR